MGRGARLSGRLIRVTAADWVPAATESPTEGPIALEAAPLFDSISGNLFGHSQP
jgi:hypothetical protein